MARGERPRAGGGVVKGPQERAIPDWGRVGRPHNVRAGPTGPRTRRQPSRPSRSECTDRVGRRRGVCEITSVDQSTDQVGSAGPGSWTNSRSLSSWSSRVGGGGACGGALGGSSASPQWARIFWMSPVAISVTYRSEFFVAFSCRRRSLCPSCYQKRASYCPWGVVRA